MSRFCALIGAAALAITACHRGAGSGVQLVGWDAGQYTACRTTPSGPPSPAPVTRVPAPVSDCRSASYSRGRIPLPPGAWEVTLVIPDGCSPGVRASGGTLATVHAGSYAIAAVSGAACPPPTTTSGPR